MSTGQDIEQINRMNFRSALNALAYPGSVQRATPLFDSGLLAVASVLLYAEVTYHYRGGCDIQLIEALTGTRPAEAAAADYLLSDGESLELLELAQVGTPDSPEFGATLLIDCSAAPCLTKTVLTGPGIDGSRHIELPLSSALLAALEEKNSAFPLGIDCFLLIGRDGLIGLPRSTGIEVVA
jgi:alpha-D-ribose 1-methylphosphonate 5-triphosphate synthase subunit PhnH